MNEKKRDANHERHLWIQANYLTGDSELYKKHREKMDERRGLKCNECLADKPALDSDSDDLMETTIGD